MHSKGALIGIRSSLIGSLFFAIVEGITLRPVQGYTTAESIRGNISWAVAVFCICSVLSMAPGFLGGSFLESLRQKNRWSKPSLIIMGATLRIAAVVLISLPDLLLVLVAHNLWSINNNPAFTIYISRLEEVIVIAGFMGSWSGLLIAKS